MRRLWAGEREAILVALARQGDLILVDDRPGVMDFDAEEQRFPDIRLSPAAEAALHLDLIAEALGQVALGDARRVAVHHRLDEQTVVLGRQSDRAEPAREQIRDLIPLIVTKGIAAHWSAPNRRPFESKSHRKRHSRNDDTRGNGSRSSPTAAAVS